MGSSTVEQLGSRQFCSECGRPFEASELVRFGSAVVCADCKPAYVQRMREGVTTSTSIVYAGFWRRFAAVIIDAIITFLVSIPVRLGLLMFTTSRTGRPGADGLFLASLGLSAAISFGLEIAYSVYFISQKGATPGKMVMGVKVVTAAGGPISVGRAFGRYFARILSGLILCTGYIMAAFDDQKRALHDHICETRVVRD